MKNAELARIQRAVFSSGWVQNTGIAFVAVVVGCGLLVSGANQIRTATITVGIFATAFIWIVVAVVLSASGFPEIQLDAPYKSIDGQSTIPGAQPIFRRPVSDTTLESVVRLTNIGKATLTNAKVRVEIPFGYDLRCADHAFNPIPGNPRDLGNWRNVIDILLGDMRPDSLPTDLTLAIEYKREGGANQDLELHFTMFGDQFPGAGKPIVNPKLCIQKYW